MSRRRRPDCEPLEARALLVGFYDGPDPVPVRFALHGSVAGTATARPASGATENVAASGRLAPLGRVTVRGTIRAAGAGGGETGTLTIDSATAQLTLRLAGAAPGPLAFQVVSGRTSVPGTSFTYADAAGAGTLQVVIAPGPKPGRAAVALTFSGS